MNLRYIIYSILCCVFLVTCIIPFGNGGGGDDEFYTYEPIIVSRSEFEKSVKVEKARSIVNSGKIYIKDDILFIGEKNEGFHIIDNSNPSNPVNLAFMKVPGTSDLAIKKDALYINSAVDLLAVKLSIAMKTLQVTKRIRNAFPQMQDPEGFSHRMKENEVIINWKKKKK